MTLSVVVDISKAKAMLQSLETAIDPRIVLQVIGGKLEFFVNKSFQTRARGGKDAWPPLAASTIEQGGDRPPLSQADYRQSYTLKIDDHSVEMGSNKPHSIYMEQGTGVFGPKGAPYIIRASEGKVLMAAKAGGGYMVFGKEVVHKGVPKRAALPTAEEAKEMATDVIVTLIKQATSHP